MDQRIVIDNQAVLDAVRNVAQRAELVDPDGKQVGVVMSPEQYEDLRTAAGELDITPEYLEEVRRAIAEGRYKSTAEVLAMFAKLDQVLSGEA